MMDMPHRDIGAMRTDHGTYHIHAVNKRSGEPAGHQLNYHEFATNRIHDLGVHEDNMAAAAAANEHHKTKKAAFKATVTKKAVEDGDWYTAKDEFVAACGHKGVNQLHGPRAYHEAVARESRKRKCLACTARDRQNGVKVVPRPKDSLLDTYRIGDHDPVKVKKAIDDSTVAMTVKNMRLGDWMKQNGIQANGILAVRS